MFEFLLEKKKATFAELQEFFVWWDNIAQKDVDSLKHCLDTADQEYQLQHHLQEHPLMLIQHLGGGHGRWVIPKQRLGAEHVTDFIIGECDSSGFSWTAVELESPKPAMFNSRGDPSSTLNHAMRQILDWRAWLQKNQNYAARPRTEDGLGLTDIDPRIPGLILIGREHDLKPQTKQLRRQLSGDLNITIHTYDWLMRLIQDRVEVLEVVRKPNITGL